MRTRRELLGLGAVPVSTASRPPDGVDAGGGCGILTCPEPCEGTCTAFRRAAFRWGTSWTPSAPASPNPATPPARHLLTRADHHAPTRSAHRRYCAIRPRLRPERPGTRRHDRRRFPSSDKSRSACPPCCGSLGVRGSGPLSANIRETREEKEIRVGRGREKQDGTRRRNGDERNAPPGMGTGLQMSV